MGFGAFYIPSIQWGMILAGSGLNACEKMVKYT